MSGDSVEHVGNLCDLVVEFLLEQPDGSAMAHEISKHLFREWSPEDVWLMARSNTQTFIVGLGDHELPPEARLVRLADLVAERRKD